MSQIDWSEDYKNRREDRKGSHKTEYQKNRRRILRTQKLCGICGRAVDFELEAPHPLSATVDHIVPIARGGHPSALENLQLAHSACNRQKSDLLVSNPGARTRVVGNRNLPQSRDWSKYRG